MHKASAYQALAREIERWRAMPRAELVERVGKPASVMSTTVNGEEIAIEVTVHWHVPEQTSVRVTAVANGPSHWRLERLQESVVITA